MASAKSASTKQPAQSSKQIQTTQSKQQPVQVDIAPPSPSSKSRSSGKKGKKSLQQQQHQHTAHLTTMNQLNADKSAAAKQQHRQPQSSSDINNSNYWTDGQKLDKKALSAFWMQLTDQQRREIAVIDKEMLLQKMKDQHKTACCHCAYCGRTRSFIENEMEQLYDAYYRELLVGYVASHIATKRKNDVMKAMAANGQAIIDLNRPQTGSGSGSGSASHKSASSYNADLLRDVALLRDFALTACGRPPDAVPAAEKQSMSPSTWKAVQKNAAAVKAGQPAAAFLPPPAFPSSRDLSAKIQAVAGTSNLDPNNISPSAAMAAFAKSSSSDPSLREECAKVDAKFHSPDHVNEVFAHMEWPLDFFGDEFTRSLAPLGNGLITVADGLLQHNGVPFLNLLEQLGTQGKHFDVAFSDFDRHDTDRFGSKGNGGTGISDGDNCECDEGDDGDDDDDDGDEDYDSEYDYDELTDEDEDDDDDDDDEDDDLDGDSTTSVERFEESRKMFQVFVGKIFEDRLIHAYKEKIAAENHERLLKELEEEEELEQRKKEKKKSKKEKKKQKQQEAAKVTLQNDPVAHERSAPVDQEEEEGGEMDSEMAAALHALSLEPPKDSEAFYESSFTVTVQESATPLEPPSLPTDSPGAVEGKSTKPTASDKKAESLTKKQQQQQKKPSAGNQPITDVKKSGKKEKSASPSPPPPTQTLAKGNQQKGINNAKESGKQSGKSKQQQQTTAAANPSTTTKSKLSADAVKQSVASGLVKSNKNSAVKKSQSQSVDLSDNSRKHLERQQPSNVNAAASVHPALIAPPPQIKVGMSISLADLFPNHSQSQSHGPAPPCSSQSVALPSPQVAVQSTMQSSMSNIFPPPPLPPAPPQQQLSALSHHNQPQHLLEPTMRVTLPPPGFTDPSGRGAVAIIPQQQQQGSGGLIGGISNNIDPIIIPSSRLQQRSAAPIGSRHIQQLFGGSAIVSPPGSSSAPSPAAIPSTKSSAVSGFSNYGSAFSVPPGGLNNYAQQLQAPPNPAFIYPQHQHHFQGQQSQTAPRQLFTQPQPMPINATSQQRSYQSPFTAANLPNPATASNQSSASGFASTLFPQSATIYPAASLGSNIFSSSPSSDGGAANMAGLESVFTASFPSLSPTNESRR